MPIATIPAALISPAPVARSLSGCQAIAPRQVLGEGAKPHPLTQEPRANVLLALYRDVGGCSAPVVVRYGVGADPAAGAK